MSYPQSLQRARDAGVRASASRRARVVAAVCSALAVGLVCVAVEWTSAAAAQGGAEIVRLRSFAPGASARLEVVGAGGDRVRLVAGNLPHPGAFTPEARAYVVWATGGEVRRLGVLRRNQRGAAALEFRHPDGLARYGVVVTAEANPDAARPGGAPVFASRALEVSAERPAPGRSPGVMRPARDRVVTPRDPTPSAPSAAGAPIRAATEERARICAGAGCAGGDFVGEVRGALSSRHARTLLLVAARGAGGRARGVARVAGGDDAAYARLRLRRVPPPSRFGARRHVLWAVTDEAGPIYIGSLPEAALDREQAFVRAKGVSDPQFRLLVTAEQAYPSTRPAGRSVLLTFKGRRRRR